MRMCLFPPFPQRACWSRASHCPGMASETRWESKLRGPLRYRESRINPSLSFRASLGSAQLPLLHIAVQFRHHLVVIKFSTTNFPILAFTHLPVSKSVPLTPQFHSMRPAVMWALIQPPISSSFTNTCAGIQEASLNSEYLIASPAVKSLNSLGAA